MELFHNDIFTFKKYPSHTNHYDERFVERVRDEVPSYMLWAATEKLHGSQLAVYCNGTDLGLATRSGFVDNFGNSKAIITAIEKSLMELYAILCIEYLLDFGEQIIFYGEYFGDGVQGGTTYGDKDFVVFDIKLSDLFLTPYQLECLTINGWAKDVKIAKRLAVGSLDAMLKLDTEITSQFGGTQPIEGYVLKPYDDNCWLDYGDNQKRVSIKYKSPKFKEISKPKRPKAKDLKLSAEDEKLFMDFSCYLNTNRLESVLSKDEYELSFKNIGRLTGLLIADAIEEFGALKFEDGKVGSKFVNKLGMEIVREYILRNK